jgi:phosphonate transport system permease protein
MSGSIRLGDITPADIAAMHARNPSAFDAARRNRLLHGAIGLLALGYLVYLHWLFDFGRILADLPRVWVIVRLMVDWSHFAEWDHLALLRSMLETVAMAYLGTMLAVVIAVPLGFLGAGNVIPQRVFRFFTRRLFDGLRGLDQLIWALVFVRAVGLGPIAGILAITVADTGVLAKLFAEAIENTDRKPIEGMHATGASPIAALRFGILPQVLPVMISQALYQIESNSREATILGLVGAGGIGLRLAERIQINAWDQVAYVIVLILITVSLIDNVSRALRMRLIGQPPGRS